MLDQGKITPGQFQTASRAPLPKPADVRLPGTQGPGQYFANYVKDQLIAKYGKGQPSQIKQLLLNGVDDLGAPGKDPFYGAGRINVAKALSQ